LSFIQLLILILAAVAATGWFSASSVVVDQLPDAALLAIALAVGSVVVLAYAGLPTRRRMSRMGPRGALGAAVAGAVVFLGAPLLVLACRRTDAPSGSEVLFFTTAAWGALAVIAASLTMRRSSLMQLAGAFAGLLGAATVVANWERPSSFSPFVKFPVAELLMLLAGVAFAAGSRYLLGLIRTHGLRPVLSLAWSAALGASLLAGAVAVLGSSGGASQLSSAVSQLGVQLVLAGLSAGVFAATWLSSLDHLGLARSAAALYLPPALLTVVAATEGISHAALGANPVQWGGALGGVALIAVSAAALLGFEPPDPCPPKPEIEHRLVPLMLHGLAVAGVALGAVGLLWPVFQVTIVGEVAGKPWSATWEMIGAEASAGWLPLVVALLALALAFDADRFSWSFPRRLAGLALVAASALSWPFVVSTPLRTWTQWLPAEVLQDLGTEYAQMDFVRVAHPIGIAALVVALVTAVAVTAVSISWAAAGRHQTESS
jgi:drug/metabolite transporter (DMT)-like permease